MISSAASSQVQSSILESREFFESDLYNWPYQEDQSKKLKKKGENLRQYNFVRIKVF